MGLRAVISVCGTAIITAEPSAASETMLGGMGVGDAAVLGAALCYALTTARLGVHSRAHDATPLAFGRMATKVAFSAALVASLWYEGNVGGVKLPDHEAIEWVGWADPYQWSLVLFTALVSEALSTALQGKGQAIVPASQGIWLRPFVLSPRGRERLLTPRGESRERRQMAFQN